MENKKNNALEKAENIAKENRENVQGKDKEKPEYKDKDFSKLLMEKQEGTLQDGYGNNIVQPPSEAFGDPYVFATKNFIPTPEEVALDKEQREEEQALKENKEREMSEAESEKLKYQAKMEKERRKAELKEQKLAIKRERRQRLDEYRQKNVSAGRGNNGFITAIITLSIITLVLASVLTVSYLVPSEQENMLESGYRKTFYETVSEVDNMDVNLSKALATSDKDALSLYMVDLAINSELAENGIQSLPLQDESKFYTTKLINQIGDYAKYINKKITMGESLTESDIENLNVLYRANLSFKDFLQEIMNEMTSDYAFSDLIENNKGDLLISGFDELQNLSVEYPELIYDGPFSDGRDEREIKGLTGENITEAQAKDVFKEIFGASGLDNVENDGETNGLIPCYNVKAFIDGEEGYAQISKQGGHLIMYAFAGSCDEINYESSSAKETASSFIESLGIEDMQAVWINLSNNVYTINFAYSQDGIKVYSDLIKVRVCAETNVVIGFESTGYYTNHTERLIDKTGLTETQARSKLNQNIEIETVDLALVPIGESSEKLCYEFSGKFDGETYYIYIDVKSGRQVEMFKVIDSTEGTLLI